MYHFLGHGINAIPWIFSFFDEADINKDKHISYDELEHLVVKMFELEKDNISKEYAKAEILIHFDKDKNKMISWDEFEKGCTNWLEEATSSGSVPKNIWNQASYAYSMIII